jgi:hypothetical protein
VQDNPNEQHLCQRMAQRNISSPEIELVVTYGRTLHRRGAEFYFLGERDLPDTLRRTHAHLIGTTVVIAEGEVRTVYRNRRAHASIRRKTEQRWFLKRQRRS